VDRVGIPRIDGDHREVVARDRAVGVDALPLPAAIVGAVEAPQGPVTLEFADEKGAIVRSFGSDRAEIRPPAEAYFPEEWLQHPEPLPARVGHNRFLWNLRLPRPRASEYEYSIAAIPGADTPALPQGLFVLPGKYEVRLAADGKTWKQPLAISADPRVPVPPAVLASQMDFYREVTRALESATDARSEIEGLIGRPDAIGKSSEVLREVAESLAKSLGRFVSGGSADDIAKVGTAPGGLATDLESADASPSSPQREYGTLPIRNLEAALVRWRTARENEVRPLDRRAREAGMPSLVT